MIGLFVHGGVFSIVLCSLISILLMVNPWGLQGYSTSPVNLLSWQCLVSPVIFFFFGDGLKCEFVDSGC